MNLEIACLSSPDYKCYALRFGFSGTLGISSAGPSSYSLRIAVGHRAPPNECSANHMAAEKQNNTCLYSLSCGGLSSGFSCCFHGKSHHESTSDILLKVVRAFKLC